MRVKFTYTDRNTIVEKFRDKAGRVYGKMVDGSLRRLSPLKPWRNKSERRQVLKDRRQDRELAAANA